MDHCFCAMAFATLVACHGYGTEVSSAQLTSARFEPTSDVDLHFEAPPGGPNMQPIAFIRVEVDATNNLDAAMDALRAEARHIGGHAVYSIVRSASTREQGTGLEFLDSISGPKHVSQKRYESSDVFTGLAVRFLDRRDPPAPTRAARPAVRSTSPAEAPPVLQIDTTD